MAEETQRSLRKAQSVRSGSASGSSSRTERKARSYREETYKPADPSKPAPQTIILPSTPKTGSKSDTGYKAETEKKGKKNTESGAKTGGFSFAVLFARIKEFFARIFKKKKTDTNEPEIDNGTGNITNEFTDELPGSEIKQKQAQRNARNDLLKKGLIGLIALIVLILIIVLIVNSAKVSDVSNLSISSTATTQTLKWSGAKKGLTYEIYRSEGSGQYQLIDTLTEGENTKTYDNLTSGTLYSYNIVTVKGNGEKTQGTSVQGYTKPNSVTRTSAVTTADKSLTVSWSLQGNTSEYELQYGLYDNLRDASMVTFRSDEAQYNSSSDSYSYSINNLVTDETYYFSIRTHSGDIYSDWCTVFSGTVTKSADISQLDPDTPMIALTFDSGPDAGYVTSDILDTLAANNALATFFPTGENASYYPETMKRIVEEGHEIGNHTYDNTHVGGEVTADDIINANTAIEAACGVAPKLFRAPQGEVTDAIEDTCRTAGMAVILFNFDSHDWEYYDADMIVERILEYAEDGDIIQFRSMDDYDFTARAIETIVPALIERGYQLVTVTQLIQSKTGSVPQAGKTYVSGTE